MTMWPYCEDVIASIPYREFADRVRFDRASLSAARGSAAIVVEPRGEEEPLDPDDLADLPVVMIGSTGDMFDCTVEDVSDLHDVLGAIERRPLASVATALLLRSVHRRSIPESLVAESTTYSMLQSGPEFREWCGEQRSKSSPSSPDDLVLVERSFAATMRSPDHRSPIVAGSNGERGDHLIITLNHPDRRNAYSTAMRSALADALEVACFDTDVTAVTLCGAGDNFSSGGDLSEFGTLSDPVTAHVSRLSSRVTFLLWSLRNRLGANLVCRVHGDNFGAGVELAAFAGRVEARSGATFTLPEVRMGLTPGSGGTTSLPARIGRQRTMFLAVTGRTIDVATAHAWGLVDDVVE